MIKITTPDLRYPFNFFAKNPLNNQLFRAICDNNLESVKKAINDGADVNCRSDLRVNWTPFLAAVSLKRKEIANFLCEIGANSDARLKDGRNKWSMEADGR